MGLDRAMVLQIHNNNAPYLKKKNHQSVIGWMTWRLAWVGNCRIAVMILSFGALIGCDVNSALERVSEAQHLSADLLVQFTKAADAATQTSTTGSVSSVRNINPVLPVAKAVKFDFNPESVRPW